MGALTFGNKRTYEDFRKTIPICIKYQFDSLREICFSFGQNVVEDVRMHRVVFGKSMVFRWFADLEPQNNLIQVKIQKNRKEPTKIFVIKSEDDIIKLKTILQDAFDTIN